MLLMPVFIAMISSPLFMSFRFRVGCRFLTTGLGSYKLGFGYMVLLFQSARLVVAMVCVCMYGVWVAVLCPMCLVP